MMTAYTRRSLQGRYADIADFTTARVSGTTTMRQYHPYYDSESHILTEDRNLDIDSFLGGASRTYIKRDRLQRAGQSRQDINCYD